MASAVDVFNVWLQDNIFTLFLMFGMVFGFLIIYKKFRSTPTQPDFIKIMRNQAVKDEVLNKPDKYEPQFLYRGHQILGKIVGFDEHEYDNQNIPKEDDKFGLYRWSGKITTVIFRPKTFWKFYLGGKQILKFKTDEANVEGSRLVFPSNAGFTALGNIYTTKLSYPEVSSVVEGIYSKRLFEANVNIMASKMSHIASESPEMAHQLNMERLRIEAIRQEKQMKQGFI